MNKRGFSWGVALFCVFLGIGVGTSMKGGSKADTSRQTPSSTATEDGGQAGNLN